VIYSNGSSKCTVLSSGLRTDMQANRRTDKLTDGKIVSLWAGHNPIDVGLTLNYE